MSASNYFYTAWVLVEHEIDAFALTTHIPPLAAAQLGIEIT